MALYVAYYNWCRMHQTLRITPAMEAGLTDHIWTLEELVGLLDAECARSCCVIDHENAFRWWFLVATLIAGGGVSWMMPNCTGVLGGDTRRPTKAQAKFLRRLAIVLLAAALALSIQLLRLTK